MCVGDTPENDKQSEHRGNCAHCGLYHTFSDEVCRWTVQLVGLFTKEDIPFHLEGQDGAKKKVHKQTNKNEEVASSLIYKVCIVIVITNIEVKAQDKQTRKDCLSKLSFHYSWFSFDENNCPCQQKFKLLTEWYSKHSSLLRIILFKASLVHFFID